MTRKKNRNLRLFFRSAAVSGICVLCVTAVYLGVCASYEAVRTTCFSDDRPAVVFSSHYIKILDFEITF